MPAEAVQPFHWSSVRYLLTDCAQHPQCSERRTPPMLAAVDRLSKAWPRAPWPETSGQAMPMFHAGRRVRWWPTIQDTFGQRVGENYAISARTKR
jgi:hypothetical protein